jgi:hypothetical protein
MPYGDVGGSVTELVITCVTPATGPVAIIKGDAVTLCGPYTVMNEEPDGESVFGQALADCAENGVAIPVKVRGICVFHYTGSKPPLVNGQEGVVTSGKPGHVRGSLYRSGNINLKVDTEKCLVHVLL